jgi:predicted double-glycine peptidase
MYVVILGVWLLFFSVDEMSTSKDVEGGTVYFTTPTGSNQVGLTYLHERPVAVRPMTEFQYRNVVHQAYDYSCGSAALTTVLNYYLGRDFREQQIMDGLLRYGEYDKIVQRRGFSLLDMKRLVTALGHPSGGYKGTFDDLRNLDHPAIVPIHYAGFKHFVVVKKYKDGHVFVADPALGNIIFAEENFKQIWDNNVMFIVFPNGFKPHSQLELTEQDMRIVDDKTISQLAFADIQDFPLKLEHQGDMAGTLMRVFNGDSATSPTMPIVNVSERQYYERGR